MKRVRVYLARLGRTTPTYISVVPPLGILSIAAYLRERFDIDLRLFDQRVENCPSQTVVKDAVSFGPDIVGLSAFTPGAHELAAAARAIREALPKALIVIGGPHVSAFTTQALIDTNAHIAVTGEGEPAFEQVIRAYLEGGGYTHIPGLIWRDRDGQVVTNPGMMPFIEDMDSLPFLAYDLVDIRKYWACHAMASAPPRKYVALFTSRGCPYRCIYCHNTFGKRFRRQSPERAVAEIEHYQRTYGVTELEILDDVFNHDEARVIEFSDLLRRRGLKTRIAFPNGLRTDLLTRESVDALVGAGTWYTALALESGSPRIQQTMRKHMNIPRFLDGVAMVADRRVIAHGFAMFGFPGETEEDLQQTIDVVCGSKLHFTSFYAVTAYPNTELYNQLKETHPEKLAKLRYENADHSGIQANLSDIPDEVFYRYQRKAWRRFYLNPVRMLRLLRDYPQPLYLLRYAPVYARRLFKGLFLERR